MFCTFHFQAVLFVVIYASLPMCVTLVKEVTVVSGPSTSHHPDIRSTQLLESSSFSAMLVVCILLLIVCYSVIFPQITQEKLIFRKK